MKSIFDNFDFEIRQVTTKSSGTISDMSEYILILKHESLPIVFIDNCKVSFNEKDHIVLQNATMRLFNQFYKTSVYGKSTTPLIINDKNVIYFPEYNKNGWFVKDLYGNDIYNEKDLNRQIVMEIPDDYSNKSLINEYVYKHKEGI